MSERWRWFVAACLFGVLFFFATDKLVESPPTWFDEGIYLQASMNDTLHGAQEIQLSPTSFASTAFVTGGYPFLKPVSWSFSLFGIGLLQARAVMVIFMIVCAAIFFALMVRLFSWRIALVSLALLVLFPPLYGQGKNVLGEVPGLLFLGMLLYCIDALERRAYEGWYWYAGAGLAAGLCVSTKPIFFLLGAAVLSVIILYRKSIRFDWKNITLAFVVFCIPLAYWFKHQFVGGDSAGAILNYYANPYGIQDLNAEVIANFLRFFRETSPMYFALLMTIWSASIAIRVYAKERIRIAEATAFSFALLVSIAYLRTAGWYRYFFVAEIPALVFLPNALETIAMRFSSSLLRYGAWALVCVFFAAQSYQLLFSSWVAVHGGRTTTHDIEAYMSTMPTDKTYFVYNTPAAVIFVPSQKYYQYLIPNPHIDLGRDQLPLLSAGVPDYILTNDRSWSEASSSFARYELQKDIDGFVIASRK